MVKNKKKESIEHCCHSNDKSPFVAIPSALGGIFLVIVILFLIFARSSLDLLIPILWAFVLLGVFVSMFALIAMKKH